MTDKEIIKALECCCDEEVVHFCSKCPMYIQDKENDFCQEDLAKKALDLINRQNAEIKSLTEKLEALGDPLQDAQYKIAEQQAEIARLKEFIEKDQGLILHLTNVSKDEYDNKIKAEAIKDFAERLKEKATSTFYEEHKYVDTEDIDYVVKEMAGDA